MHFNVQSVSLIVLYFVILFKFQKKTVMGINFVSTTAGIQGAYCSSFIKIKMHGNVENITHFNYNSVWIIFMGVRAEDVGRVWEVWG